VAALQLRACSVSDGACEPGLSQGRPEPPLMPGYPPGIRVSLPARFQGYLRLEAPDYVGFDYYLGGPVLEHVTAPQVFPRLSQSQLLEFLYAFGVTDRELSAGMGVLAVQVFDCNHDPAPDVALRLSDENEPDVLAAAQSWALEDRIPLPDRR